MKKITLDLLPKKLMAEVDFEYVTSLSIPVQRAATYYEYARHSGPIKQLVAGLRTTKAFNQAKQSPEYWELVKQIAAKVNILRLDQLLVLAECEGFPAKPFKNATKNDSLLKLIGNSFGIVLPCFIPFPAIDAMRADWKQKGINDLDMLENLHPDFTFRVLAIPRHLTAEELSERTGDLLRGSFSSGVPQRKQPGRKGRSKSMGTVDLLRQLAAYRLNAAGYDCSGSDELYRSHKGWNNAITAVDQKVSRMMESPFFG